ncbi:hypothetical protein FGO68_gene10043 [Halteria grandinella]|uniref:Ubiquitin-like domain-containing protein n=1 Tax=Halteria grandinella TaxID=5974 RepID=A0A8J8NQG1_HALGN|nr:hypothetical protein FGO68_gene10043 [Halteria grandinella]
MSQKQLQLFLKGVSGKTVILSDPNNPVTPSTTIKQLRKIITIKTGVSVDEQVLVYAGKPLTDIHSNGSGADMLVSDYNMVENGTLFLGLRVMGGSLLFTVKYQKSSQGSGDFEEIEMEESPSITVAALKKQIAALPNASLPPHFMKLMLGYKDLLDFQTLGQAGITAGSVVIQQKISLATLAGVTLSGKPCCIMLDCSEP